MGNPFFSPLRPASARPGHGRQAGPIFFSPPRAGQGMPVGLPLFWTKYPISHWFYKVFCDFRLQVESAFEQNTLFSIGFIRFFAISASRWDPLLSRRRSCTSPLNAQCPYSYMSRGRGRRACMHMLQIDPVVTSTGPGKVRCILQNCSKVWPRVAPCCLHQYRSPCHLTGISSAPRWRLCGRISGCSWCPGGRFCWDPNL